MDSIISLEEVETVATKMCSHCRKTLPLSQFSKSSHSPSGYQYYCKECGKKTNNERRAKIAKERDESLAKVCNPDMKGITDRELQESARATLNELRHRGWQIECEIAYLHKKKL